VEFVKIVKWYLFRTIEQNESIFLPELHPCAERHTEHTPPKAKKSVKQFY
jgi:hypothetical protein